MNADWVRHGPQLAVVGGQPAQDGPDSSAVVAASRADDRAGIKQADLRHCDQVLDVALRIAAAGCRVAPTQLDP